MTRSSLTEETPSAPGWVDGRVRSIFARVGPDAETIGQAYADCLASVGGATDVDLGHDRCRQSATAALKDKGIDIDALDRELQALEAEISNST